MRLAKLNQAIKMYNTLGDDVMVPKDTVVKVSHMLKSEAGVSFELYCGILAATYYTKYNELPFEYIE